MNDANHESWWLATLGRTIVWARLREREAGTAEVFDSDGNTLAYDSLDTARAALMDAEFVDFDGLDEDDNATVIVLLRMCYGVTTVDGKPSDGPVITVDE